MREDERRKRKHSTASNRFALVRKTPRNGLGNWCSVHTARAGVSVVFPYELVAELAEIHTVVPQCEGPTPSFHHFTAHIRRLPTSLKG
jgi:hypothetical protein